MLYTVFLRDWLQKEGGNTTEFDVVLRSHQVKHWKNGKFDAVTTEMTTEIIKLEILQEDGNPA